MAGEPKPCEMREKWVRWRWMLASSSRGGRVLHRGDLSLFSRSTSSLVIWLQHREEATQALVGATDYIGGRGRGARALPDEREQREAHNRSSSSSALLGKISWDTADTADTAARLCHSAQDDSGDSAAAS